VALVSQSGAIAEEVIASSHRLGIPLGAVISVGNAMHLGLTEYLDELGADSACRAVLLYAESFGDVPQFRAVARRVSARKPVVALVGGRTAPGRGAAFRHTGSQAPNSEEAEAFSAECGMVRATNLRRLMLAGKAFGAHPGGIGPRVLVLSNSGGPGVLCTDQTALEGLALPDLPAALATRLRALLPPEAAIANPLDLLADAREDRFADTLVAALEHGASFDAIVVSNHGGRQLDCVPSSLRVLPEVVKAVNGQVEILMDGGIRRGTDIVKALCLGAKAVLCGRAYAYGLAAAGEAGVARALDILRVDLERTLKLLGSPSVTALNRSYVNVPKSWDAS